MRKSGVVISPTTPAIRSGRNPPVSTWASSWTGESASASNSRPRSYTANIKQLERLLRSSRKVRKLVKSGNGPYGRYSSPARHVEIRRKSCRPWIEG